jgi:hypothetical protein
MMLVTAKRVPALIFVFELKRFGPEKLCAPVSFLGEEASRSFTNMVLFLNHFFQFL